MDSLHQTVAYEKKWSDATAKVDADLAQGNIPKYNAKTDAIQDMLVELNKKYYNPYILQELLDEIIRLESDATLK